MAVNEVYLDNSATTKVCAPAAQAVMDMMTVTYGNPSSLHRMGMEAEQKLIQARESAAALLGVTARELFFTSGGTEANNLSLLGAAAAGKRRGKRIVTTVLEHASVYDTAAFLESEGFEVVFLQPGPDGNISPAAIQEAITPDTILVSMMLVNNETGASLVHPQGCPHCPADARRGTGGRHPSRHRSRPAHRGIRRGGGRNRGLKGP